MTILTPTQLETADYGAPGWVHIFNKNIDLLNTKLLAILELVDVDPAHTPDGGVLVYHSSTNKWKIEVF